MMMQELSRVMVSFGAGWVIWVLVFLSVVCFAIAIERARLFWSLRDDVPSLVRDIDGLLEVGDLTGAGARLERSPGVEARVLSAGLSRWQVGAEAAEEAMAVASGLERSRLERRLLVLGTIGNNAPFIGLLGTVIGVVGAFEELRRSSAVASSGASGALAPERVMGAIAEALVATAVGLLVAIPAVAMFNYFQGMLAERLASSETLGHLLLAHLRGNSAGVAPKHRSGIIVSSRKASLGST